MSAHAQSTLRLSLDSNENEGNDLSGTGAISGDGRFKSFVSVATNLVPGDTNNANDIFVRDSLLGLTERVSIDSSENQAVGHSGLWGWAGGRTSNSLSLDGRYVAFQSGATNLVPDDTNGLLDIFVRDRQMGTTERVSIDSFGNQGIDYWGSGYVMGAISTSISRDGRYVAFDSNADNLVIGDIDEAWDVFVRDRQTGTTESFNNDGILPSISGDGRYVAFITYAADQVLVRDRQLGSTTAASVDSLGNPANGLCYGPSISDDGRYVAFVSDAWNLVPGDFNGLADFFVHDMQTGTTECVSLDTSGSPGGVGVPDNYYLLFDCDISKDGRYAVFASATTNLVSGDVNGVQDVFLRDRLFGFTYMINPPFSNGFSWDPVLSDDGRYVGFTSVASNLVVGDANNAWDFFANDHFWTGTYTSYCTSGTSASGCQGMLNVVSGSASETYDSGFVVAAQSYEGQKSGLFLYGQNGQQMKQWGNGTSFQCVAPPLKRGPLLSGTGALGSCDGLVTQDLNAVWCSTCPKPNQTPTAGWPMQIQFWYRDPLSTSNQSTSLTNAIEVGVVP